MLILATVIVFIFTTMIVLLLATAGRFVDSGDILTVRANTKAKQNRVSFSSILGGMTRVAYNSLPWEWQSVNWAGISVVWVGVV